MVNTVGHRTTEMALQLGLLYKPSEALNVGLVDQVVPEEEVLTQATQNMTKWLAIPGMSHIPQSSDCNQNQRSGGRFGNNKSSLSVSQCQISHLAI